jgi:ATP-binding cassette subfamily C protein LapB
MTTGGLAACSLLAGRALQPLQRAIGIWNRFQTFALARDRLREMFELEVEAQSGMPPLPPVKGRLELRNISFRYGEKMPWILKDVSVTIEAGECIAIVGGNGSGKTTLLALMQGTLAPTVGRVLVDGNDLQAHDPHTVRTQIAYLPQHGMLFQGTILQNITMYRNELDLAAMDTADALGLDEVVATMAQGYDTPVGDSAYDSLPRGIRQRIAIARALVNDPKVVLFDEANTAVDGAGDKLLTGALEHMKGRNSMVLVTHRPSMIRMADRVFDLSNGTLSERTPEPPAPPAPPPAPPSAPQPVEAA